MQLRMPDSILTSLPTQWNNETKNKKEAFSFIKYYTGRILFALKELESVMIFKGTSPTEFIAAF